MGSMAIVATERFGKALSVSGNQFAPVSKDFQTPPSPPAYMIAGFFGSKTITVVIPPEGTESRPAELAGARPILLHGPESTCCLPAAFSAPKLERSRFCRASFQVSR